MQRVQGRRSVGVGLIYPKFRAMSLCVASGVVEGSCKNIVGTRLKQSAMCWTVYGANAIIILCCAVENIG